MTVLQVLIRQATEHCYALTCNEAIADDANLMCVTDESEQGFPITLYNTNSDETLVCQSVVLDDDQYQGDYWCPEGYEYTTDNNGTCIVPFLTCDAGFTGNLTNGCNDFLSGDSWWNQYTGDCFDISEPNIFDVRTRACCFSTIAGGYENYEFEEVVVY
jgi:hypothetical protein